MFQRNQNARVAACFQGDPNSALIQGPTRFTVLGPEPHDDGNGVQDFPIMTQTVGTAGTQVTVEIKPYCEAVGTHLLLVPEVADEVDIVSVTCMGQNLLGGPGWTPGRLFVDTSDECCPKLKMIKATSATPYRVTFRGRGGVASLGLRFGIRAEVPA